MALVAFKANIAASQSGDGGYRTLSNPAQTTSPLAAATTADTAAATVVTDATTADTDVGTVQSDLTTAFNAFNTFAAAIIAITGDTFNTSTHQFTFGGATGLTHAQIATDFALLNTAMTDFVTAQTDAATAKTATALTKTDATTAKADTALAKSGSFDTSSDVTIVVNNANITRFPQFTSMLRAIEKIVVGSSLFTP